MPQPKKGARLGAGPKHQKLMLSNLALSLFEHEKVRTTEAKAKALRPFAERLITKAKTNDVHHRRQVLAVIEDREIVHKLFADIGPRFAERPGGYTRILKLGPRQGDGAPMAIVELVEGAAAPAAPETSQEAGRRRRLRRPGRTKEGRAVPAAEAGGEEPEPQAVGEPAAEPRDASVEEASEEATGDEPVGAPGDAGAATSQGEPGEGDQGEGEKRP